MDNRKKVIVTAIIVALIGVIGVAFFGMKYKNDMKVLDNKSGQNQDTFTGVISEINDGTQAVVSIDEGHNIRSSGDKVYVSLPEDKAFKVGDKIKVTYTGEVMESDPLQINQIKVEIIE